MTGIIKGIVILVVALFIFSYFTDDNTKEKFDNFFSKIKSNSEIINEDSMLMSQCKTSFNNCKQISEAKYGFDIQTNKIQEFYSYEEAIPFIETWGGSIESYEMFSQITGFNEDVKEGDYPMVFFAISVGAGEMKLPSILFCDNTGNLLEASKDNLKC